MAAPVVYDIYTDQVGSPTTVSTAGNVVHRRTYDSFGRKTGEAGALPSVLRRGFGGHDDDTDSGLVYMRGRFYSPEIRRFLSADPFVQDLGNTADWNRFAYTRNNPVNRVDPTGFVSIGYNPDYETNVYSGGIGRFQLQYLNFAYSGRGSRARGDIGPGLALVGIVLTLPEAIAAIAVMAVITTPDTPSATLGDGKPPPIKQYTNNTGILNPDGTPLEEGDDAAPEPQASADGAGARDGVGTPEDPQPGPNELLKPGGEAYRN